MKHTILIALLFGSLIARAQEKHGAYKNYQGLYGGTSLGIQNIFGGAYIDELDVLSQKSGFVFELLGGYRLQLLNSRLVLGAEFLYGFADGDLSGRDPRHSFIISYRNDRQLGLSLNLGYAFGESRKYLAYLMYGQGSRTFNISFTDQNGMSWNQEDKQTFDRLGIGFEAKMFGRISLRAHISSVLTDYGALEVSQNVEDKFDFNMALIFQL